jgi:hypothetical protein
MGARLYDPVLGRFTSRDPVFGEAKTPMSLNRYVYGWDNPVSNHDPDGLLTCHMIDGMICANKSGSKTTSSTGKSFFSQPAYGGDITWKPTGIPPMPPAPPKPVPPPVQPKPKDCGFLGVGCWGGKALDIVQGQQLPSRSTPQRGTGRLPMDWSGRSPQPHPPGPQWPWRRARGSSPRGPSASPPTFLSQRSSPTVGLGVATDWRHPAQRGSRADRGRRQTRWSARGERDSNP